MVKCLPTMNKVLALSPILKKKNENANRPFDELTEVSSIVIYFMHTHTYAYSSPFFLFSLRRWVSIALPSSESAISPSCLVSI